MRWLTRILVSVTEASQWRHCFWHHRHRRLMTTVMSVITVVVFTIFLLGNQTPRQLAYDGSTVNLHGSSLFRSHSSDSHGSSLFRSHPSVSTSSPSSPSSAPSSSSNSSLSHFPSVSLSQELFRNKTQSHRIQQISSSSSQSSSSEPLPPLTSGVSSRSRSRFPTSFDALDVQPIDDTRYSTSARRSTIDYHSCSNNITPSISPPSKLSSSWQRIEVPLSPGKSSVSFLFSAHYDPRSRPRSVLILGLTNNFNHFFADSSDDVVTATNYYCQFRYRNDSTLETTTAHFTFAMETHGRRYAASFHICYLRHDRIPLAVSIVTDRCQSSPGNQLPVQFTQPPSHPPKRNFTVCVTPLSKNYNDANQLVEMIEVNRMFGAQKFTFYNQSTGPEVDRYLRSYEKDGLVEVIPWRVPVTVDPWPDDPAVVPEVHYYAQLVALNDCLYRNLLSSRFVVFSDLDELIVPRGAHVTWAEVLESATRRLLGSPPYGRTQTFPGAYVIKNTFFRSDWGEDSRASEDPIVRGLKLRTLLKTRRETVVHPWYRRSKCIVWTKAALMVGIHSVAGYVDDERVVSVLVDQRDALLHHYRKTMWPDDPLEPPRAVEDRRMHRFYGKIMSRTLERHTRLRRRKGKTGAVWL